MGCRRQGLLCLGVVVRIKLAHAEASNLHEASSKAFRILGPRCKMEEGCDKSNNAVQAWAAARHSCFVLREVMFLFFRCA